MLVIFNPRVLFKNIKLNVVVAKIVTTPIYENLKFVRSGTNWNKWLNQQRFPIFFLKIFQTTNHSSKFIHIFSTTFYNIIKNRLLLAKKNPRCVNRESSFDLNLERQTFRITMKILVTFHWRENICLVFKFYKVFDARIMSLNNYFCWLNIEEKDGFSRWFDTKFLRLVIWILTVKNRKTWLKSEYRR